MADPVREEDRKVSLFANPISILGLWLAGVSFLVIVFMMVVEATSAHPRPYVGIITFIVLPIFLLFGLALFGLGAVLERRRRASGGAPAHWPVFDFNHASHRRALASVTVGALIFLMLTAFGSFKAYEYTESNEFCGTTCHAVMEPEFTAYQNSAHSRVHCVECHIGPGAEWFVRSKISGAYQVYAVLADKVPRPIHTPIANLRPSSDTCENCHWPEKFFGNKYVRRDYYLSDEENTHFSLDMMLRIGGGDGRRGPEEGIHWHMNIDNRVEYVAADERRQQIDWVRVTRADGSTATYVSEESDLTADEVPEGELRVMDCVDCHNRPSHRFLPPHTALNAEMTHGTVSPDLPSIKANAVELLEAEYIDKEEALAAIEEGLNEAYSDYEPRADVDAAIAAVQKIYGQNYFPEMNTSWKAFPENIGHLWAPGCFRCHDGLHANEEGEVLTRDCTTCHLLLAEETVTGEEIVSLRGIEYQHPEDIDLAWQEMNCTECHAP